MFFTSDYYIISENEASMKGSSDEFKAFSAVV